MEDYIDLLKLIWPHINDKKKYLVSYAIIASIIAFEFVVSPYLLKMLVDSVATLQHQPEIFLFSMLKITLVYVIVNFLLNINNRMCEYLNLKFYPELKERIISSTFYQSIRASCHYFHSESPAVISKKIADLKYIENLISMAFEWFLPRIFTIVTTALAFFFLIHPILGITLLVWTIIFTVISFYLTKKILSLVLEYTERSAKIVGIMTNSLSNISTTKIFVNELRENSVIKNSVHESMVFDKRIKWLNLKITFFQNMSVSLLIGSLILMLVYCHINHLTSIGDFAFVVALSMSYIHYVYDIGRQTQRYAELIGICKTAMSVKINSHQFLEPTLDKPAVISRGRLEMSNVSFSYKDGRRVIRNLNLTIQAGESIGIMGNSGCGKSTLLNLILRFFEPMEGQIMLDGQNITDRSILSLRNQITCVPQKIDIFSRTVFDNIKISNWEATRNEVIKAAKLAECHNFIMELHHGYDFMLSDGDTNLSGGQIQRIGLARAFLKKSPILLLDEPTSALDLNTEESIMFRINREFNHQTTIIISHRLSALRYVDKIFIFDNGNIVREETFDSLSDQIDFI